MLILSRRPGEEIIIGPSAEPVAVVLMQVGTNKARIGVKAPREVAVHRKEIWEAIEGQKKGERLGA